MKCVRGGRFSLARNSKADVVFLQETYSTKDMGYIWKSEQGGKICYSHGSSHSKDVTILFNPKLDFRLPA